MMMPNPHGLIFQIKVCETCQHTERNKNLSRTVRPIKVDAPWDIVGIDIIGFCFNLKQIKMYFVPLVPALKNVFCFSLCVLQGLSRRPSNWTHMLLFSLITLANGPRHFQCKRWMLSPLRGVFPNVCPGKSTHSDCLKWCWMYGVVKKLVFKFVFYANISSFLGAMEKGFSQRHSKILLKV